MELSKQHSLGGFIGALCLVGIIVIFACIRWEDVVEQAADGSYSISREREEAIEERIRKLEELTELYVLKATVDGYYFCPACPLGTSSNGKYFLYRGEVYKYGITMAPKERYGEQELSNWQLKYVMLDVGNRTKMEIQETILIGNYPGLPENLKREPSRRLAFPPGSGINLR